MARELTVSCTLNFRKGALSNTLSIPSLSVDVSGTDFLRGTVEATTSIAALPLGAVASLGFLLIVNHDATNYCDIYASVSDPTPLARVKPGEPALFRLSATAPAVLAHTATVQLEYLLIAA